MKKEYSTPELKFVYLSLQKDILKDSKWEPSDNPIIDEPVEDDFA